MDVFHKGFKLDTEAIKRLDQIMTVIVKD